MAGYDANADLFPSIVSDIDTPAQSARQYTLSTQERFSKILGTLPGIANTSGIDTGSGPRCDISIDVTLRHKDTSI